ncbi:MAG TPA: hypothetical protein VIV06_08860 [Candidatus Limnocylindrales bacterium]
MERSIPGPPEPPELPRPPVASSRSRDELLAAHREARERRATAELGGEEYLAAIEAIAEIEVEIARLDRAAEPPVMRTR